MKLKRILAVVLAFAMVLSSMSFSVFAESALPNAEVRSLGALTIDEYGIWDGSLSDGEEPIDLQVAMEFIAKDSVEEAEANAYADYTTDFFLTMDGVEGDSFIADGCYLAGNYGTFGWIMIPLDGMEVEEGVIYPVITSVGFDFKYVDICRDVQDFKCGIYFSEEVIAQNPDLKVTLQLGLSKDIDAAQAAEFTTVDKPYTYNVADFNKVVKLYRVSEKTRSGELILVGSFASLEEALIEAQDGDTIKVINDFEIESQVSVEKAITLDLNGYTVSGALKPGSTTNHIYAIANRSTMTIMDSVGEGSIDSRGIYNYGKLTLESGAINAIDGNGGYAINNEPDSEFVMNGGIVATTYEDDYQSSSGGYDATAMELPAGAVATLNGGKIINVCDFTFAVDTSGTLNIPADSTVEIIGTHGAIYVHGGKTTIDAGTFKVPEDEYLRSDNVLYVSGGALEINGGTFVGDNDVAAGGSCLWDSAGTAEINGGSFSGSSGGDVWGTTGTVIKGGSFGNLTEKQHIADGFEIGENGIVTKITPAGPVATVDGVAYLDLQSAIDNAYTFDGNVTITLLADYAGDVTIKEKAGLYLTLDGADKTFKGSIKVNALSDVDNNRRTTIKNINFVDASDAAVDFISSGAANYYPHITVENCDFAGSGDDDDVAVRLKDAKSVVIKNCKGTGLHSFLQNTAGWDLKIENVTVTDSKGGMALGTVQGVTVEDCDIDVKEYGIRLDAKYNNNAVIADNNVDAFIPVVVRKAEVDTDIAFEGENTMTASNTDGIWCAIGESEYEENGVLPTAPKANVNVVCEDTALTDGIYGYTSLNNVSTIVTELIGSGTEEDPYLIGNLKELIFFRDSVNKGETTYNASGVYVALADDIDMAGCDWSVNIGDDCNATFDGIFDGKGHKLSNLTSVETAQKGDVYVCTGLFGAIYGSATIKNLTIENATINTGDFTGNNAGIVVGFIYEGTGSIENVNVIGDIKVDAEGIYGVGAIAGYSFGYNKKPVIKNCSVVANAGSYIKASAGLGGIIGYGGAANVTDSSVANINLQAQGLIGGIVGVVFDGAAVTDCYVENANLTATKDLWVNSTAIAIGSISSSIEIEVSDITYEDVNTDRIIGSTYAEQPTEVVPAIVAKVDGKYYTSLDAALTAASALTGDVTVELYNKGILNKPLTGNYSTITFVGKAPAAEIYMDIQGYIEAPAKEVAFEDLKLSKVAGGYVANAGFMNLAFGIYGADSVSYDDCVFLNGAYSSGKTTFTDSTFYRSHDRYGLWVYGDTDCTVEGCTFDDIRGIKVYHEGALKTADLTVKNTVFTENVNGKPAIVLTNGKSVTLEGNTYSDTGVFELDLDGNPDGTVLTSDVEPTCINDNGACGVLVNGKIYATVAAAAAVAEDGDTITLLHDSRENITLDAGVILDRNGFAAAGVVAASSVAIEVETYEELIAALNLPNANVVMKNDITATATQETGYGKAGIIVEAGDVLDGNGHKLTINGANATWDCAIAMTGGTVKNLTVAGAMRGIFMPGANDDVVIDNVVFEDVIYTFNSDAGSANHTVTVKNTTLNGWTSFSNAHKAVTFETCTFGEGNGNAFCRPYQATTFVDCAFEEGYIFDSIRTAENTIAFNDCTYNGAPLDADNGEMFYTYGGSVVVDGEAVEFIDPAKLVATIGNESFVSLKDAFDAAVSGDTITLIADIAVEGETFTIPADKAITLDMNGKTITAVDNKAANVCYEVFYNYGELTVTGEGTINLTSTSNDTAWAKSSSIFHNRGGVLNIENGTFTHLGGTAMAFVVDNSANSYGDATTNINGGSLNSTYIAIRNRMEATGSYGHGIATLNVTDGDIFGYKRGIWGQASSTPTKANITISGGSVTSVEQDAVVVATNANSEIKTEISGGTFSSDVSKYLVDGASISKNNDGTYGVVSERIIEAVASEEEVVAGQEFTVAVKLAKGENIFNAEWTLVYDTSLFELKDAAVQTGSIKEIASKTLEGEFFAEGETLATYTFVAKAVPTTTTGSFTLSETTASTFAESIDAVLVDATTIADDVTIIMIEYDVTATLNGEDVDLTVANPSAETIYTGEAQQFVVSTDLPAEVDCTITYTVNGVAVEDVILTEVGTYEVVYTITTANGYVEKTGTVTIKVVAPDFVVETAKWTAMGKKLVLVYTKQDDMYFTYDGKLMIDVTSKGYKYENATEYDHVFAFVTDDLANDVLESYKEKVAYISEAEGLYLLTDGYSKADINFSNTLNVQDISVEFGIVNLHSEIYGNVKYQKHLLKGDTNGDKYVNGIDTGFVVSEVKTAMGIN